MARHIIVDIDGLPTAIVPRGENQPPIILYTLPPPPYYKHNEFELIDTGGPPRTVSVVQTDDETFDTFWCKFILMFFIIVILGTGIIIILLNW
jgi:hypothetical protein